MKSPRFDFRAEHLRTIFSAKNLERTWTEKVRTFLKQQGLNDGIEHFDFHVFRKVECERLSRAILTGEYVSERANRILSEKNKGLCRQLVIPSVRDALVLQCLSDSLNEQIRNAAPTDRSFFEIKEHRFSSSRSGYGTYTSWLNFQKELFRFSEERKFVVITDIANYYDSISYVHLRNSLSGIGNVQECILDMLIHVLSGLLWQPDYMPRIEIGLPQINLDAPRILAHCFLFDLDKFLDQNKNIDFVRYMDDIDVGLNSIAEAKRILKSLDLVLQTKQIRLNGGKTQILTQKEALEHFWVRQNLWLTIFSDRIDRKKSAGITLKRERNYISRRINIGLQNKYFDKGNGDKVLKRYITMAGKSGATIKSPDILKIFRLRPSVREAICGYVRITGLTTARVNAFAMAFESGLLVDDLSRLDVANYLVEARCRQRQDTLQAVNRLIKALPPTDTIGLYATLWISSKFGSPEDLFKTIHDQRENWMSHESLGRLIGSFTPLFERSEVHEPFRKLMMDSRNHGFRDTYKFHLQLRSDRNVFHSMFNALKSPNPSRGTGITHPKFLCLLSALNNPHASASEIKVLVENNSLAWADDFYRKIRRRVAP